MSIALVGLRRKTLALRRDVPGHGGVWDESKHPRTAGGKFAAGEHLDDFRDKVAHHEVHGVKRQLDITGDSPQGQRAWRAASAMAKVAHLKVIVDTPERQPKLRINDSNVAGRLLALSDTVFIHAGNSPDFRAHALLHEMHHYAAGHLIGMGADQEVVAEAATHLTEHLLGVSHEHFSVPYVTHFGGAGAVERLRSEILDAHRGALNMLRLGGYPLGDIA